MPPLLDEVVELVDITAHYDLREHQISQRVQIGLLGTLGWGVQIVGGDRPSSKPLFIEATRFPEISGTPGDSLLSGSRST